jgi:hypothetical protein
MLLPTLADADAVDYEAFLDLEAHNATCRPEQARATEGSEGASKDPDSASFAMPIQGVLTKQHATAARCNRPHIAGREVRSR